MLVAFAHNVSGSGIRAVDFEVKATAYVRWYCISLFISVHFSFILHRGHRARHLFPLPSSHDPRINVLIFTYSNFSMPHARFARRFHFRLLFSSIVSNMHFITYALFRRCHWRRRLHSSLQSSLDRYGAGNACSSHALLMAHISLSTSPRPILSLSSSFSILAII